jgi:Arc/MetJ-type ribon-helix-helix transcriptional regulator
MTARKTRLTVTVDAPLVRAGQRAVKAGRAASLSAWVNEALAQYAADVRRREAAEEALGWYEKKHGAFTADELQQIRRDDRENAIVVRGRRPRRTAA